MGGIPRKTWIRKLRVVFLTSKLFFPKENECKRLVIFLTCSSLSCSPFKNEDFSVPSTFHVDTYHQQLS